MSNQPKLNVLMCAYSFSVASEEIIVLMRGLYVV